MKAKGLLITAEGEQRDITFKNKLASLSELQEYVGGYIEIVWLRGGKILVVNEEGKINGLPINMNATYIIGEHGMDDNIVGNAILMESKYIS